MLHQSSYPESGTAVHPICSPTAHSGESHCDGCSCCCSCCCGACDCPPVWGAAVSAGAGAEGAEDGGVTAGFSSEGDPADGADVSADEGWADGVSVAGLFSLDGALVSGDEGEAGFDSEDEDEDDSEDGDDDFDSEGGDDSGDFEDGDEVEDSEDGDDDFEEGEDDSDDGDDDFDDGEDDFEDGDDDGDVEDEGDERDGEGLALGDVGGQGDPEPCPVTHGAGTHGRVSFGGLPRWSCRPVSSPRWRCSHSWWWES